MPRDEELVTLGWDRELMIISMRYSHPTTPSEELGRIVDRVIDAFNPRVQRDRKQLERLRDYGGCCD